MSVAAAHRVAALNRRCFRHWTRVLLAAEAGAQRNVSQHEYRCFLQHEYRCFLQREYGCFFDALQPM
jgi:hypothetical protein